MEPEYNKNTPTVILLSLITEYEQNMHRETPELRIVVPHVWKKEDYIEFTVWGIRPNGEKIVLHYRSKMYYNAMPYLRRYFLS